MIGIVLAVLILGVSVFFHELGHFLVMRRNGIKVLDFSIGFGPCLLCRKDKSGTQFTLRAIPIGGFVQPEQAGPTSMKEATPWVTFKVAVAGPMANCLVAFLVGLVLLYSNSPPILQHDLLAWAPDFLKPIVLSFVGSFGLAITMPLHIFYVAVTNLSQLFSSLAGPIGIVQMGSQIGGTNPTALSIGLGALVFVWMINVGLAGANLLPFHPLDGGHCIKAIMAKIPGLNRPSVIKWFNYVTAGLLITLIVLVMTADIMRLFGINLSAL
ncbi:MAG: site-2 protease family protein [Patescibacteria group bacterium]